MGVGVATTSGGGSNCAPSSIGGGVAPNSNAPASQEPSLAVRVALVGRRRCRARAARLIAVLDGAEGQHVGVAALVGERRGDCQASCRGAPAAGRAVLEIGDSVLLDRAARVAVEVVVLRRVLVVGQQRAFDAHGLVGGLDVQPRPAPRIVDPVVSDRDEPQQGLVAAAGGGDPAALAELGRWRC